MGQYLEVSPNSAVLKDETGTVLRCWDWQAGGTRHMMEIVGEGNRTRRVEVMLGRNATAGSMKSDEEGAEILRGLLRMGKGQIRFWRPDPDILVRARHSKT